MNPMISKSKDIKAPYRVRVFDRESYNGLHIGINPEKNLAITICAFPNGVIRVADCKNCVSEPLTLFQAVKILIDALELNEIQQIEKRIKEKEEGGQQ